MRGVTGSATVLYVRDRNNAFSAKEGGNVHTAKAWATLFRGALTAFVENAAVAGNVRCAKGRARCIARNAREWDTIAKQSWLPAAFAGAVVNRRFQDSLVADAVEREKPV